MRVGVIVLVHVLFGMIFLLVCQLSEVTQGPLLEFLLGYLPSEVMSLVGGAALLEVSDSYLKADFLFSPDILSGLVGVGLRRAWVRSVAESFAASFGEVLGNVRVSVEISAVSETISLDVL